MDEAGLAGALIRLVHDIEPGLLLAIEAFCWIAGLAMFLAGCVRVLKHSNGERLNGFGTAFSFVAAAILVSLPSWITAAGESLFGSAVSRTATVIGYGTAQPEIDALLSAVFTIVNLVGLIAFIRGVFLLRDASDNKAGVRVHTAAMHLLGGVAAWHIHGLIEAVQSSLGIRILENS